MPERLPEPPVPPDLNVSMLDGFMLSVKRLLASELWALSTGDEFKAAMGLWCRAWQQTPGGSLPDDERVLASFSGAGRGWGRVKNMAMRGFVKCSDGRFYHTVLCGDAMRATKAHQQRRNAIAKRYGRSSSDDTGNGSAEHSGADTKKHTGDSPPVSTAVASPVLPSDSRDETRRDEYTPLGPPSQGGRRAARRNRSREGGPEPHSAEHRERNLWIGRLRIWLKSGGESQGHWGPMWGPRHGERGFQGPDDLAAMSVDELRALLLPDEVVA